MQRTFPLPRLPRESDGDSKGSVFAAEGLASEKRLFSEASEPRTRHASSGQACSELPPAERTRAEPHRAADPRTSSTRYGSVPCTIASTRSGASRETATRPPRSYATPWASGPSPATPRSQADVHRSRTPVMTVSRRSRRSGCDDRRPTTPRSDDPRAGPARLGNAFVAPRDYGTHRAPMKCEKAPKGLFVVAGESSEPRGR